MTKINNKSSQTFNWFTLVVGWGRGGVSLKNWSKQSACTAVANEVATILFIFLSYFSPVVTHFPERFVVCVWNFACTPK